MKESGGSGEDATDPEVIEGIQLLAETTGIFAETAGGVTVACAKKLIASGAIPRHESVVLCITGNGLKTLEAVPARLANPKTSAAACANSMNEYSSPRQRRRHSTVGPSARLTATAPYS